MGGNQPWAMPPRSSSPIVGGNGGRGQHSKKKTSRRCELSLNEATCIFSEKSPGYEPDRSFLRPGDPVQGDNEQLKQREVVFGSF